MVYIHKTSIEVGDWVDIPEGRCGQVLDVKDSGRIVVQCGSNSLVLLHSRQVVQNFGLEANTRRIYANLFKRYLS